MCMVALAAFVPSMAGAFGGANNYEGIFNTKYPDTVGTKLDGGDCTVCHTSGFGLNGYGQALKDDSNNDLGLKMDAVVDLDSDGDNSSNIIEIMAGTWPGDTSDFPAIACNDNDGDGFYAEGGDCGSADCNDSNGNINPIAIEDCTDGIDNDCDGLYDISDPNAVGCPVVCTDNDGDGYATEGVSNGCGPVDCDDTDADVNPDAVENCSDTIDNDCNNLIDTQDPGAEGCPVTCTDNDGDSFAIEGGECGQIDCDDTDATVNPDAVENCTDSIDNDCDGSTDDADPSAINCPVTPACNDFDGDGFYEEGGDCGLQDCDDTDAAVNPGAVENCTDSIDNDCDGSIDDEDASAVNCPVTPLCTDADGDGYNAFLEGVDCGPVDCDDANDQIKPGAAEDCTDGVDNNCNDHIDVADSSCQVEPPPPAEPPSTPPVGTPPSDDDEGEVEDDDEEENKYKDDDDDEEEDKYKDNDDDDRREKRYDRKRRFFRHYFRR